MTYPEDVLVAAREAAAKSAETQHLVALPDMYRDGTYDRSHEVRTACIAIMAERQRCAEFAAQEAHNAVSSASKAAATAIACAILGQQETGGRRQRVEE